MLSFFSCALAGLVGASEWIGDAAEDLKEKTGMEGAVIGLAMGFTSSLPELFVTSFSGSENPEIGLGNVIGSNIANPLLAVALPMAIYGVHASRGTVSNMNYDNKWMLAAGVAIPMISAVQEFTERVGIPASQIGLNQNAGLAMMGMLGLYFYGKVKGRDQPDIDVSALVEKPDGEAVPELSDELVICLDDVFGDYVDQKLLNNLAILQNRTGLSDDEVLSVFKTVKENMDALPESEAIPETANDNGNAVLEQLEEKLGIKFDPKAGNILSKAPEQFLLDMAQQFADRAKDIMENDPITDGTLDAVEETLGIEISDEQRETFFQKYGLMMAKMGIGGTALIASANMLVDSGASAAVQSGIDPSLVGLIAVAVGTSLPEITINMQMFKRQNYDEAFGNILGSNVFNTFLIGAVASMFIGGDTPAAFDLIQDNREFNKNAMLNYGTLVLASGYAGALAFKPEAFSKMGRAVGMAGVGTYAGYVGLQAMLQ